jgi:hypothetical protein
MSKNEKRLPLEKFDGALLFFIGSVIAFFLMLALLPVSP